MFKHLLSALSIAALILFATDAAAFCLPIVHYRCVGDHAVDSSATDATIQAAIDNTVCSNTVITITHEIPSALSSLALDIDGKSNLTLVGVGPSGTCSTAISCDPELGCGGGGGTPPPPAVTLHGNGAGSVIYIHGSSNVTLQSLELTGGGGTDFGGGIHFTGSGALTIVNSTITGNSANSQGGGIQFNASGGNATLTLGAGTIIDVNDSGGDGGGIHINGAARLFALKPYTYIASNQALSGHGGGLYLAGPAQADIGSAGYNGAAVISFNSAQYGGGIAMDAAPNNYDVKVRIFGTDPHTPAAVSNNRASNTGGGIWMHPYISGISNTEVNPYLCAFDFRIDNNVAQEGTAIYGDTDSSVGNGSIGSVIFLNSDSPQSTCNTPESMASIGAVHCASGVPCNTMNGSVAENNSNSPTPGSAILIQDQGSLFGARFSMRGNAGQHAIRTLDGNVELDTCLIADNTLTAEMLRFENDGSDNGCGGGCPPFAVIKGCTVVNNSDEGAPVIYSAHALALTDSIIDELSINTVNYAGPGGGLTASDVLATDISTLPSAAGIDQGEPLYVDAANHDYHLLPTSTGIDFAPAAGGVDLDGNPRDVNLSGVQGNSTPRDIGAYERQNRFQCGTSDSIFCNGYEYSW